MSSFSTLFCHLWLNENLRLVKKLSSILLTYLYPDDANEYSTCKVNKRFSQPRVFWRVLCTQPQVLVNYPISVLGKMILFLIELLRSLPSFHGCAKPLGINPLNLYKKMVDNGEDACSEQRWRWLQYLAIYSVLSCCIKPPWRKIIQQVRTVISAHYFQYTNVTINFRLSDESLF